MKRLALSLALLALGSAQWRTGAELSDRARLR